MESFPHITKPFCNVTKSCPYVTKPFRHITKPFPYVTKSFRHVTKQFFYIAKSFLHITKRLPAITKRPSDLKSLPGAGSILPGAEEMSVPCMVRGFPAVASIESSSCHPHSQKTLPKLTMRMRKKGQIPIYQTAANPNSASPGAIPPANGRRPVIFADSGRHAVSRAARRFRPASVRNEKIWAASNPARDTAKSAARC